MTTAPPPAILRCPRCAATVVLAVPGAVTAVVDRWAYLTWNLGRKGTSFWGDSRTERGFEWHAALHARSAAAEPPP
jgi:hypothetical protein